MFAEALGCLVAPADWPEKVGMLLKEAGIPAEGMILKDACGLSPMDAVPASVFTDLLVYADKVVGGDIGPFIAGGRKRRWFKWLLYRSDSIERTDAG